MLDMVVVVVYVVTVEQASMKGARIMERTDYKAQGQKFLDAYGFSLKVAFKGDRCPPWEAGQCVHGDRYRITIRRRWSNPVSSLNVGKSISFDFWGSQADMLANKRPTPYDVLACISSDAHAPTDPDEVGEEFGEMRPSQATAIARFAARLQAFFTEEELEALSEIS